MSYPVHIFSKVRTARLPHWGRGHQSRPSHSVFPALTGLPPTKMRTARPPPLGEGSPIKAVTFRIPVRVFSLFPPHGASSLGDGRAPFPRPPPAIPEEVTCRPSSPAGPSAGEARNSGRTAQASPPWPHGRAQGRPPGAGGWRVRVLSLSATPAPPAAPPTGRTHPSTSAPAAWSFQADPKARTALALAPGPLTPSTALVGRAFTCWALSQRHQGRSSRIA